MAAEVVTSAAVLVVGVFSVAPSGVEAVATPMCGNSGTPSVVALADPNFYVDFSLSPQLNTNFAGYSIRAGTSTESGLTITLSNFTGGSVGLTAGQAASMSVPSISPGSTSTHYFAVTASSLTTTAQTHTITLSRAGVAVCERTFTYVAVRDTIKALANKVRSVAASVPNSPAIIGDLVVVTVDGDTGTLGAGPSYDSGVLSYAPTAYSTFAAGGWKLEKTEMTISPDGVLGQTTYVDKLYLSGASGPDRPYTAKYYFRSIGPAVSTTSVQPVQYIASGTQVKHTDLSGFTPGTLPVTSSQANISLAKTVNTTTVPSSGGVVQGARVTYSVTATNYGNASGTLDKIVDTLASGTTYVSGTALVGRLSASVQVSGQTLTLFGPFTIAAGGTLTLTYQVDIPAIAGTYTNSAVAMFGNVQIDGSRDITTSTPATADVVVQSAPGAVIAVNDAVSTNAASAVTISILSNDTPSSGVSVSIVRNPSSGTAVLNANNTVTYTPNAGFGGSDTFDYTITVGGVSSTATVTVSVPLARPDTYAVGLGQVLTANGASGNPAGVAANDECSKATCTFAVSGSAPTGTFSFNSTGTFSYTAGASAGVVTFNYTLTDAAGKTSTATVTITVNDFGPDYATTAYNTLVTIPISTNDTCRKGNGDAITCTSFQSEPPNALYGTTASFSSGSPTYTPNPLFWGNDEFGYQKGSAGGGRVYTMTAPPTATKVIAFGQTFTRTIPSTSYINEFATPNVNYSATVSCASCSYSVKTAPTKGSVSVGAATGTYTYTPGATAIGSDSFVIEVVNARGQKVNATVNLTLGPDAVNDSYSVFAGETLSFNVLNNDNCPATCTVTRLTSPSSGTLNQTVAGGGAFTYSNSSDIGSFTFTYQVQSSTASDVTDSATVTIVVDGARNDTAETTPGVAVNITVTTNDPCSGCTISAVSTPSAGTASNSGGGVIQYTPPAGYAGYATFTYTVTKNSRSTNASVTVTVKPDAVNDTYSVMPSSTQQFDVLDNDVCASCAVTAIGTATSGSAAIVAGGGAVTYTSPVSSGSAITFTYTITDSTGATDEATVTVTLATAPTIVNDATSTNNGTSVAINVKTNDTCPAATTCFVDFGTDPSNGVVSISANPSFDFQYTPKTGFTGTDTFTYLNIASNGLSASGTVTVKVLPSAANDSAVAGLNQAITISVLANDVCDGCVIGTVTTATGGTAVKAGNSLSITYTAPAVAGTYTFDYTITENDISPSESRTATVTVQVGDASPDYATTPFQTAVTTGVVANDTCAAFATPCKVSTVDDSGSPANDSAVKAASDMSITYTPAAGFVGIAIIPYTASNGSVTATTNLRVLVGPTPLTNTTTKNTQLTGNVLTGTTCGDCIVSLVLEELSGLVTLDTNGSYTFTPKTNWTGTEPAITYKITDSVSGLSQNGTLTLSVYSNEPSVTLDKSGTLTNSIVAPNDRPDAGDRASYSYVVTNTGNVTLTNVTVTDDKIASSAINCPNDGNTDNVIASLAAAASATCTATYTLIQSDINSGSISNIATVSGTPASGSLSGVTDSYSISLTRSASMSLDKSTTGVVDTDSPTNGVGDIGDQIPYDYVVTNTGNVTLSNVTVTDDKIASSAINCPNDGNTDNIVASLIPGAAATCTATYTIVQADIDSGGVTNNASISGSAPAGATAPTAATDSVTVSIARTSTVTVVKTGTSNNAVVGPPTRTDAGDSISYSYVVTNTGNVTLTSVTVTDDKILSSAINCPNDGNTDNVIASLAPAVAVTCTAPYTVTQADVNAGSVSNVASVSATPPSSMMQSVVTDTETISIPRVADFSVDKTGSLVAGGNSRADAGDTISYSYLVTNTGNVTLSNVTVTDDKIASSAINCPNDGDTDNVIATLLPGISATCTASYTVAQADVNAGSITNVATLSGTASGGNPAPTTDSETVTLSRVPSMSVAKSGTLSVGGNSRADAGDAISYSYLVTNTGNVTLTSVTVTDDKIASSAINCPNDGNTDNVIATLLPGNSATCTASYMVAQADMNAGSVSNLATVSSTATGGNPSNATDTETVTLTRLASMTIAKVGVLDDGPDDIANAGDTIAYSYTVTNTGNVTLTSVTVTDDKIASSAINCPNDGNTDNVIASLAPGGNAVCSASHTVTSANVTAGSLTNVATVSATGPGVNPSNVTDSATVVFSVFAALTVSKTGAADLTVVAPASRPDAGDKVTYSYAVTNSGTAVLSNVTVVDDKIADDSTIKCPGITGSNNVIPSLAVGATVTCSVAYVLTQADVDAGSVTNTATVTATPPGGVTAPTAATDSVTLSLLRTGELTVSLSGVLDNTKIRPSDSSDPGDEITYSYKIENVGNVSLSNVVLTDLRTSVATDIRCPEGSGADNTVASLSPGATVTCGVRSILTQTDVDAKEVPNTVTASYAAPGTSGVKTASASGKTSLIAAAAVANTSPETTVAKEVLPVCVSPTKDSDTVIEALRGAAFTWKPDVTSGATATTWRVSSGSLPTGITLNSETGQLTGEPSVEGEFNFSIEGTTSKCSGTPKTGKITIKFVVQPSGIVAGILWFDMNKNSKREKNEPLLPGATVKLEVTGGTVQAASVRKMSEVRTTVTSATGFYKFEAVPIGKHDLTVEVNKANALKGSWEPDGTPDFRVTVEVEDKKEVAVEIAVVGSTRTAGTAILTPSLKTLPFAPVTCVWAGLDGVRGTSDDVPFTTTTLADGTYVFEGIPAGDYSCSTLDKETGKTSAAAPVVVKASFAGISVAKLKQTVLKVKQSKDLPDTGTDADAHTQLALLLILTGLVFLTTEEWRRRRRRRLDLGS